MRLVCALTLLAFVAITVRTAPTKAVSKETTPPKTTRDFVETPDLEQQLESQVERVHENEALDVASDKQPIEEDDETEAEAEADETEMFNLDQAGVDIKNVLKYFFNKLKQHPEIVQDLIQRESEKLLNSPLQDEAALDDELDSASSSELDASSDTADTTSTRDVDMDEDVARFEKPSPQLQKIPKRVVKKAGIYPPRPKFTFEPVEGEENKYELQAVNPEWQKFNSVQEHASKQVSASDDLTNVIPSLQQASSSVQHEPQHEPNPLTDLPVPANLREDISIDELKNGQEVYSKRQQSINTLPRFDDQNEKQETDFSDDQSAESLETVDSDESSESLESEESEESKESSESMESEESEESNNSEESRESSESSESMESEDSTESDNDDSRSSEELDQNIDTSETSININQRSETVPYNGTTSNDSQNDVDETPDQYYYYYYDDDDNVDGNKDYPVATDYAGKTQTEKEELAKQDGSDHFYETDARVISEQNGADAENTKDEDLTSDSRQKIVETVVFPADSESGKARVFTEEKTIDSDDEEDLLSLAGKGRSANK